MEPRQYLTLLRRWAWILALGVILGVLVGYVVGLYQETVYEASTKLLVQQASQDVGGTGIAQNELQLAQTITELMVTRDVLEETSNELGYHVSSGQVSVQRVSGSQIIELVVEDEDPQRAADIANSLVTVFLVSNERLQSSRFAESEESLQVQLQQVREQIAALQSQYSERSQESLDAQLSDLTKTIADLQAEIRSLQEELITMQYSAVPQPGTDQFGRRIMVTPTPSVDQRVEIAVKSSRLDELQSLLNQYQEIYVSLSNSSRSSAGIGSSAEQIQTALVLYNQIYTNLLNNYEAIRLARLRSTPNITQVEAAVPPSRPVRPKPMTNMTLGAIMGLMLAGGIAFAVEYLDDTMRTPTDVTRVMQLPVLGYIGDIGRSRGLRKAGEGVQPLVVEQPRSPVAEAFRSLRTNLEFIDQDGSLKTLLITSPGHSEGKTTVAVNLAVVMAQSGKRVVLVDADMRRPSVHLQLDMSNRVGLSDVLQNRVTLPAVEKSWRDDRLVVVTSGRLPPNPAELLSSGKMLQVIHDLQNQADVVIVDGPPFALADALVLSAKVDGVLVVIQPNRTAVAAATAMLDQLERAGSRVIGIALNRIHRNDSSYYYKTLKDYNSYSYDA